MTAHELIIALKSMPQNAPVLMIWDGEPRSDVDEVHISSNGEVVLMEKGDAWYSRPGNPPWQLPKEYELCYDLEPFVSSLK